MKAAISVRLVALGFLIVACAALPAHGAPPSSLAIRASQLQAPPAALGVRFYTGAMFPPEYRGQLLIAEHGSWNRSTKIGYRLTRVRLDGVEAKGAPTYEPFVTGFLAGGQVWGRPVDLLELPDGSVLVSDDHAGAIYRVSYRAPGAS